MEPQRNIEALTLLTVSLAQGIGERVAEIVVARQETARGYEASPAWLDVNAAATYLATTPQAIRAAVKRSQLPGKRPNGRVMFTREELDRYVTQGSA